jgi:hypothetical protein
MISAIRDETAPLRLTEENLLPVPGYQTFSHTYSLNYSEERASEARAEEHILPKIG